MNRPFIVLLVDGLRGLSTPPTTVFVNLVLGGFPTVSFTAFGGMCSCAPMVAVQRPKLFGDGVSFRSIESAEKWISIAAEVFEHWVQKNLSEIARCPVFASG